MPRFTTLRQRLFATAASVALVASGLLVVTSLPAAADTAPPVTTPVTPTTVSADVLPTVQIDGVVWAQVVVGNTVYAAGSFANARPAGAAAGTNQTTRNNLLAYDITTGNLVTSFVPNLNGQALAIAASPDGKRLYVGGDFTSANGSTRSRLAAYDLTTNTLVANFAPVVQTTVRAIVATNSTVYFGGDFTTVNGATRPRVAAVDTSGNLLNWNPNADAPVTAMTITPDGSKVVIGGRFQNMGGNPWYGMAAVDPITAATLPWAAVNSIQDAGVNADITSLTANGDSVYGTGYVYGSGGNLEGTFRASQVDGSVTWVEDCHGDSYSVYAGNSDLVYVASHSHFCGDLNGFPQSPTTPWDEYRGTAFTKAVTQTLGHNPYGGYKDWYGTPAPSLLNWFPTFVPGTYTGAGQAGWSVTGNSQYTVYGGEFPTVNGVAQQGLVRFAVFTIAPNKVAPNSNDQLTPTVVAQSSGAVRVSWLQTYDRDNTLLTYKVYRNFKSTSDTPIYQTTATNTFWQRSNMGFVDTSVVTGQTYNYRVYVSDPFGNTVSRGATSITAPGPDTHANQTYPNAVLADQPQLYWRLGESSTTTAYDSVAYNDGVKSAGVTKSTDGILAGDSNTASAFDGNTDGLITTQTAANAPNTFSVEAWVKTSSTSGGKIIGYGSANTGSSGSYDRHVYMDNTGHIWFGVYTGATQTLSTTGTYNDNQWHQVVATLGANGMQLFIDGKRVGARTDVTAGQAYTGYWRVGGDNLNGWPSQPSSNYLAGLIDEVAIYPTVLGSNQVNNHYVASGRTSQVPPRPSDSYGQAVYDLSPDLFWRLNEAAGATTAADSGQIGNSGTVGTGVSFGAAGALAGQTTTAATLSGAAGGAIVESNAEPAPSTYSAAVWFKTTTTTGGKLIGFGDSNNPSQTSSNYDRHVYMQDNGQLVFGTYTGSTNTATSAASYNDGQWHLAVATQGSAGMVLYVDGKSVATNPQTGAQSYTGYWRIGGDSTWGSTSAFFAGTLDEAAVFSSALTAPQVANLYTTGAGQVNQPPTAAFTSSATNLAASFDGSTSSDPDGTVASYSWNFGDGSVAGSGQTTSYTYAAAGTYTVTLTVTDNQGATNSVSHTVTVTAANQPPVAAFTSSSANLAASFDGSTSADPDGTVASYSWNFGDGSTAGSGKTTSYTYANAGTYTVTLTVTDNQGATNSVSHTVTVTAANQPPVAAFTSSSTNLAASFDGSTSSDPDGTVASYSWNFGDGSTAGSGKTTSYTYANAGTYTVTLTVTDNQGATNSVSHTVTVTAANQPPVAAFTSSSANLAASFDGSTSSDPDGTVASYSWNFGDGSTAGTGKTTTHSYTAAGTYTVTLTVTDNQGATNSVSHTVTVTTANQPPVAAFTSSSANLAASFDGSTSSDPDGTVASYSWNFGDGSAAGTGKTTSHSYTAAGTYSVVLTVTDNQGATGTVTHAVTVTASGVTTFANDLFGRTVANGLGTADQGGAWTVSGTASQYAVNGSAATFTMAAASATPTASLASVSSTSTDVKVDFSLNKTLTGGGVYVTLVGRRISSTSDYRSYVKINAAGQVTLVVSKRVSGTETVLSSKVVSGLTYTPGTALTMRLQVSGTSTATVNAKIWTAGGTEPAAWQASVTDSTSALSGAGGIGLVTYLSSTATNAPIVATFDNLSAQPVK